MLAAASRCNPRVVSCGLGQLNRAPQKVVVTVFGAFNFWSGCRSVAFRRAHGVAGGGAFVLHEGEDSNAKRIYGTLINTKHNVSIVYIVGRNVLLV